MTKTPFKKRLELCEYLITDAGRADLATTIADMRRGHGQAWLAKFKKLEPDLCQIIDLCANHTFDDAFRELHTRVDEWIAEDPNVVMQAIYRGVKDETLRSYEPQLAVLHAAIKAAIDKPRFENGGG